VMILASWRTRNYAHGVFQDLLQLNPGLQAASLEPALRFVIAIFFLRPAAALVLGAQFLSGSGWSELA